MKYRNLSILIFLIIVWSLFFAIYKYFLWWVFKTDTITLQFISWYMSIWTIWAFIIWWLLYEFLKEKKLHFFSILFTILFFSSIYYLRNSYSDYLVISVITIFIGFFYWLWWILKTIMISTEIHETKLGDTKINWIANIAFITSIIIWSIIGWKIAELYDINWSLIIIILLTLWLIVWLLMNYKHQEKKENLREKTINYKNNLITDFSFVIKKYFFIMLYVSLILAIATILSQKAIEYSVDNLWKTWSQAAIILLYSAIWSIIWNLISMKLSKNRWVYFFFISILFWITTFLFPTLINNFLYTSILAFIAWLFFWINYNLLESYFLKKIADDDKKAFWAITLWIILSTIIAIMMFLVDFIENTTWFNSVYYFMWIIIFIIWIHILKKQSTLNN